MLTTNEVRVLRLLREGALGMNELRGRLARQGGGAEAGLNVLPELEERGLIATVKRPHVVLGDGLAYDATSAGLRELASVEEAAYGSNEPQRTTAYGYARVAA